MINFPGHGRAYAEYDFILRLGASEHIDYEEQRFEDVLHDMDFVLD